jgi:peptide/nickel transport system permease protein
MSVTEGEASVVLGDAATSAAIASVPGVRLARPTFFANLVFWIAAVWLAIVIVVALTVQWLPIQNYTVAVGVPNVAPHLGKEFLGTNGIGQSMLSRICYGARISITIGIFSTAIGMVIGGVLGLLSAQFGGILSAVVDLLSNSVLAIPPILLLLAIVAALQPSLSTLTIGLAIVVIPTFARVTRANALSQMARGYVIAARSMGAANWRLMLREVLPNVLPAVLSYAVISVGNLMIAEGSLSFLGLGIPPPTPSWGGMIAEGQARLAFAPWPVFLPCVALFLTVYSLNTLGDRLLARLDIRAGNL